MNAFRPAFPLDIGRWTLDFSKRSSAHAPTHPSSHAVSPGRRVTASCGFLYQVVSLNRDMVTVTLLIPAGGLARMMRNGTDFPGKMFALLKDCPSSL